MCCTQYLNADELRDFVVSHIEFFNKEKKTTNFKIKPGIGECLATCHEHYYNMIRCNKRSKKLLDTSMNMYINCLKHCTQKHTKNSGD